MGGEFLGVVRKNSWEEVQVRSIDHEGRDYIDIRVFKITDEGKGGIDALPTGKGVTVKLSLLPDIIQALEQARSALEAKLEGDVENRVRRYRAGKGGQRGRSWVDPS